MAYIHDIFRRYLNNSCTEEELSVLLRYFELDKYSEDLTALVEQELLKIEQEQVLPEQLVRMVEDNRLVLTEKVEATVKKDRIKRLSAYVSIAASLLLVGVFAYFYFQNQSFPTQTITHNEDVEPGTHRATLVLENGQSIELDGGKVGIAIDENGFAYTDGTPIATNQAVQYVTLAIPRKGQYQAVLPDGTKVWLNAESSLRYPTAFVDEVRQVELQGEAYFEVVENSRQPFVVKTEAQDLKVLGTTFNVHAYPNELHTITTLVSGSVALSSHDSKASQILQPSQQAVLGQSGYRVATADIAMYTAWKDGEFRFKATPLPEVIRQLERWYDLEVDYDRIPEDIKIHASIRRDKNLSSVLYALEKISNIKYEIKGRRLQLME